MPEKRAQKIRNVMRSIAANKEDGLDIKRLKNTRLFRVRIGQYRAEYYFVDSGQCLIVGKIGVRGGFYK